MRDHNQKTKAERRERKRRMTMKVHGSSARKISRLIGKKAISGG